jgi:putative oxidoreductase
MVAYSATSISIAVLILRVAAGAMLIPYGYDKLVKYSEYAKGFPDPFQIGPGISLCLTIFAELVCSSLAILGLFTRYASIPLIINMSMALFLGHHGDLFGDGQKAALFLTIFIAILFTGPGRISVDGLIRK